MTLGCASHTYSISDRDGGLITASGVLTAVEYARVLNDAGTARVAIGVSGADCCAELSGVRSWRQFLNIFRGDEFVWSGPIIQVVWSQDQVEVTATDLIGFLDRRVPHRDMSFTDTDLTEIARDLVEDGFQPDDPGHTTTVIGPALTYGGRAYQQNIGQTADHLRDLAETGIDFTAVGTNVIILPDGFCDVVGRLSDDDLPEGIRVIDDGASLATRWVVAGSDNSGDATPDVVGTAGGPDPYYGLVEQYVEQTTITSQAAADAAAQAKVAVSSTDPAFIDTQNITIAPTAPVTIPVLVPGWCLDITTNATCRTIAQRLKITGLSVSETADQERVQVQVAAPGAVQGVA